MTSESILVFLAVLDHGSFSAAARALGRVPSAVSMAIAQLEAELDLPLFERRGREPVPTAAAHALEPQARQIASQWRQWRAHALALHQGLERRLVLAIAPELLSATWSAPLAALAHDYPALEVEVLSAPQTDALRLLHEGQAHVVLAFERPAMDEREAFQEVGSEILVAVIAPAHPWFARADHTVDLSSLQESRQIVVAGRGVGPPDPRLVHARHVWRTDSHLASLGLVQAGLGWAFLPRTLVAPLIDGGALRPIVFAHMSNEVRLWVDVVWSRERAPGLGARRFIDLMSQAAPA
ncbi:MAG: LysR family transcriptional regulator [Pigmentiphaga sp.]|nr:LysR family transcriptional regulator [Pigmentiphaga sp.]